MELAHTVPDPVIGDVMGSVQAELSAMAYSPERTDTLSRLTVFTDAAT
jgi:hypothetical protein